MVRIFLLAPLFLALSAGAQSDNEREAQLLKIDRTQYLNAVGIHSDCNEKKTSIEELNALAASPNTHSMQDFLQKIPPGTLQTFTFVTNSQSLHRGNETGPGKVSPLWPRVLRSSADGKITISFVCDPENPTYGKVETIYHDDATHLTKSVEWDFGPGEKPIPPPSRVHQSPKACVSCHGAAPLNGQPTLKFIWQDYFFWGDCHRDRGFTLYGMVNDQMHADFFEKRLDSKLDRQPGCDPREDDQAHKQEVKDYDQFLEKQKDNECFNTLPWPSRQDRRVDSDLAKYPYANEANNEVVFRPNLHLTHAYSRLFAQQLLEQLKKDPARYNAIKFTLAREALCMSPLEKKAALSKFNLPAPDYAEDPDNPAAYKTDLALSNPILYQYGKSLGLRDRDFSLEFHLDATDYNTGLGGIANLLDANILRDVGQGNDAVKAASQDVYATTFGRPGQLPTYQFSGAYYESDYSCLDDTGNQLKGVMPTTTMPAADKDRLCGTLLAEEKEQEARDLAANANAPHPCPPKVEELKPPAETKDVPQILQKLDAAAIERGRRLVQIDSKGKCVMCHSAGAKNSLLPPDLRFVPNEKDSAAEQEESRAVLDAKMKETGFTDTLDTFLNFTKDMPPIKNDLTDDERQDIQSYILSLKR